VIFTDGMTKTVEYEQVVETNNSTLSKQTMQVLDFLGNARANFATLANRRDAAAAAAADVNAASSSSMVKTMDMRVTLLQDRYLFSTFGLALNLRRVARHRLASGAVHDPAKVLLDLGVTLALGGDCLADIAVMRAEPGVYGRVASDPTVKGHTLRPRYFARWT
jgi:hypothetical protein